MERRKEVYEARQNRVEAVCKKFNVTTTSSEDQVEDLINRFLHNDTASGKLIHLDFCGYFSKISDSMVKLARIVMAKRPFAARPIHEIVRFSFVLLK